MTIRPDVTISTGASLDLECYVDSDWAGCSSTRKSTSGGLLYLLGTPIMAWSRTQSTVALSSGEAELYAMGSGVTEAIHIRHLLLESQVSTKVSIKLH